MTNCQKKEKNYPQQKILQGFTFVELLVVLVTMVLLFSVGYANYRDFYVRELLNSAANSLKADLRLAQSYAGSGVKPSSGCTILDGYRIRVDTTAQAYYIEPVCDGSALTAIKTIGMGTSIYINAPSVNPILFKVVTKGTNIIQGSTVIILAYVENLQPAYKQFWQTYGAKSINVTIGKGGEIY